MTTNKTEEPPEFEVDAFRDEDAEGITALFREVYGEGYPIRKFYEPEELKRENKEGICYSVVARLRTGRVIGVCHVYRSAPHPGTYEAGAGLVSKAFRSIGVNTKILSFIQNDWLEDRPHIEEMFGEAVCNHVFMQQSVAALGYQDMALEVALMPAEAYTREKSAPGRVATILLFRGMKPYPHAVYLPEFYEEELRFLYAGLDDERELRKSVAPLPRGRICRTDVQVFSFASVARIVFWETGEDLPEVLDSLESDARRQGLQVLQIWLQAAEPWSGAVAFELRRKGYFFGGLLPRWFGGDGFLMQRLVCPPDFGDIKLFSERAKKILEFVERDWRRASGQAARD